MTEQPSAREPDRELFDKAEAADYLKTTERHMESLANTRKIGHSRVGRFLRFTRSDLDHYLASTHTDPLEGV